MIVVRAETPADHEQVREVHRGAFQGEVEADIVDALRGAPGAISLVAAESASVVGHIFFCPVEVAGGGPAISAAGLGPMAVLPEHQRRGIGSRLVREGLEACRRLGFDAVVLVGHPSYYPRFGFGPAGRFGLRCAFDVPDEAFMALPLAPGGLPAGGGLVRYRPEFGAA
jgi:putative acetyltransferase